MNNPIIIATRARSRSSDLPALIANQGRKAAQRFVEFFTANIRNHNTRAAYLVAVRQFCDWCEARGLGLADIDPVSVAAYVEQHPGSRPTVKQHLAAIRMLFDWLVIGQVVPLNPASSVRGPRHIVKKGKTPVLSAEQARRLLESIPADRVVGLRDRALIAVMVYSFARVSAVVNMKLDDYYQNGRRWWIRLHEKGGKFHEVPVHHKAEAYMDAYIHTAGIRGEPQLPLFRTAIRRTGALTCRSMSRNDAFRMIKRRAKAAGLPERTCCHSFRATGITDFLKNGGTIEAAQKIAAHESPRTTKLYDRRSDEITLNEIERIAI